MNHVVKIHETSEDGSFLCPGCKRTISPDDLSERNYSIKEIGESEGGWAALIVCKCGEVIRIEGLVEA